MIKLAAFDVDGTIRDNDLLPLSTKRAIRRLQDNGITVALCTGRSESEMKLLRAELGIDWAITCNGNHIGYQGATRFGRAFTEAEVDYWIRESEAANHCIVLYGAEEMWINRADDTWFRQAQRDIGFARPLSLPDNNKLPEIYQCIVFCEETEEHRYIDRTRDDYYLHRFSSYAFDINPRGTNKAVALLHLLDSLGIKPEEAAAFGDGSNDIQMLAAVGCGIAMGNGIDAAKQAAKYVTKALIDDGVEYAVNTWIIPE